MSRARYVRPHGWDECRFASSINRSCEVSANRSSGGLIALGLFLKQWDVPHCIRLFRTLTRESFGEQGPARRSRLKRLKHYLKGLITDGCYDVGKIERALKSSFGETQKIFDCPEHRESRCKVAVTATTISDAITFLFSNYNGSAQRESTCGEFVSGRIREEHHLMGRHRLHTLSTVRGRERANDVGGVSSRASFVT